MLKRDVECSRNAGTLNYSYFSIKRSQHWEGVGAHPATALSRDGNLLPPPPLKAAITPGDLHRLRNTDVKAINTLHTILKANFQLCHFLSSGSKCSVIVKTNQKKEKKNQGTKPWFYCLFLFRTEIEKDVSYIPGYGTASWHKCCLLCVPFILLQ